jgi:hypothetical protein
MNVHKFILSDDTTQETALKERFNEWLREEKGAFNCDIRMRENDSPFYITLIKNEKNEDFDFVYAQCSYNGNTVIGQDFNFVGVYCKTNNKFISYNLPHYFSHCYRGDNALHIIDIETNFEKEIHAETERIINNDKNNLGVKEIKDKYYLSILNKDDEDEKRHYDNCIYDKAREKYMSNINPHDFVFKDTLSIFPCTLDEETLFEYVLNPVECISKQVLKRISLRKEDMYFLFIENDMIIEAYDSLISNPDDSAHIVKSIIDAVAKADSARTVNVTINVDGVQKTAKSDIYKFRNDTHNIHYYTSKLGWFKPDEIEQIKYKKTVLYEKQNENINKEQLNENNK